MATTNKVATKANSYKIQNNSRTNIFMQEKTTTNPTRIPASLTMCIAVVIKLGLYPNDY
jgi:hypothetical protein